MKTKIYHIAENYDYKYGGVNQVVKSIIKNVKLYDHEIINIKSKRLSIKQIIKIFSVRNEKIILHIHGVWNPAFILVATMCVFLNISFTISSHGMLKEIIWKQKGFLSFVLKYIYWNFFAYHFFKKAKKIHAVEKLEFKNIKNYFKNNKIITIYHLYDFDNKIERFKIKKNFIFLGRIAAHKGIDILINSFSKIKDLKNFQLLVYGPVFDKNYFKGLQNLICKKKLEKVIFFRKPINGKLKKDMLSSAWAFLNASRAEALGLTNFDAAKFCLPIIASNNCGLGELKKNGGITINPTILNFKSAIKEASKWSLKERINNGKKINIFFKKKFSKKVAVEKWNRFYQI